jgi:carbon monoxide dehydrogenase subunit G
LELTERFVVSAAVDRVWELLDDVPQVVSCMPGAEVTERVDDDTYRATLAIAVGPIRPKFDVRATVARDDAAKEGRIEVLANDKRGSQARAHITYSLVPEGDATAVVLVQTIALSGPLAQFGRTGVIEDVNAQMTRQFAECLAEKLAAPAGTTSTGASNASVPAAAADTGDIKVLRLVARALSATILKRLRLRN